MACAQTFTTLVTFDGTDGANPGAALVQALDGNLYGTTESGGLSGSLCSVGCGTVFRMTPGGTLTTLYDFCSQSNCADGFEPFFGPLIQGTDGNLYGTTVGGGAYDNGTIFKISLGGTLTTLHSFGFSDGASPYSSLIQASDGNFYGTTFGGGAQFYGTVFKMTPGGTLTTLYSFCAQSGCADGAEPEGALLQANDGNFYGATFSGGTGACSGGCGTVFKITPTGTLTTLHSFAGALTDGQGPIGGLVGPSAGILYGTTYFGGANSAGTIFKITTSGAETVFHNFDGTDGGNPYASLIQASDGSFYGTTQNGGTSGLGTIFAITPAGRLTTLYSFCSQSGCADGGVTRAGLVQDTSGKLYGASTFFGNASGDGTTFSLSVGLRPFVEAVPTSGRVGAAVKILGTNLTGATSVTFNGTAATFTVVSHSLITTTVPAGATTGSVLVTTPGNTLKSNVPFRIP
ncbi:MAG TPA: choice-of-anchor tandem repeat GloVer-containing protein [Terriglobia bacterium]|nr:choice-of-anchor tandem repeat GloVer-containing protein [Terriglobia bacterium]